MRLPYSAVFVVTLASAPAALAAQTVVSGEITGQVSGSDRSGLSDAVVTLSSSSLSREATTDLQGRFTLQFLAPGLYEMRVEAFGYRPVVFPSVRVEAGVTRTVSVTVTRATPPVTQVDTAAPSAAALSRWSGLGPLLSAADLDGGRTLLGGARTFARFSSALDPSLGVQGLPGELTTQVVDGVPFFQARHPYLHGEDTESPAFPATLLGGTSVLLSPRDVYWLGSSSGTLASETRSGTEGGSGDIGGGWSGKPLWSSSTLSFDTPALASYQAAFHAGVSLVPDTSRISVAGEVLRQQSPMAARITDATPTSLQGLDASLLESLTAPNVETVTRASGMARLDKWSESSRFTLRAAGGRLTRTYEGYGPGRLGYGVGLPDEATDLSAAMAFTSRYSDKLAMEFLGGLSLSDRVYGNADGAPAATLVTPGVALGNAAGSTASVSRVDIFLSPAVHIPLSSGNAKVGVTVRATRHTFDQAFAGDRDLFFADAASLGTSSGVFAEGTSSEVSFSTSTFGAFGQYSWNASPGLRITVGARVDWEKVPTSNVTRNAAFLDAAGVANDAFPSKYLQPGGIVAASWDVRGDGRTLLTGSASMLNGSMDPAVLHEVIAQDGASKVRRFVGDGVDWPDSGSPSGTQQATILTLLGPDIRPPRTTEMGGGLVQDLGSGWTLRLAAAARRTDFLPRRRNL
ncbi:MAG: carboxypeptidase-like regulatory domain-containing protein, partial [Gemmatimonadota bacterium]